MLFQLDRIALGGAAIFLGASLPTMAFATQSNPERGAHLEIGFFVEGGQINTQPLPLKQNNQSIQDGSIITGEDLLGALQAAPPADQPQEKFRDSTLLLSVESDDGTISSREKIAFCRKLDLYSEPSTPDVMKARCDSNIFEYTVAGHKISFLRNGEEIGSFELEAGFYLINGTISRIPVLD